MLLHELKLLHYKCGVCVFSFIFLCGAVLLSAPKAFVCAASKSVSYVVFKIQVGKWQMNEFHWKQEGFVMWEKIARKNGIKLPNKGDYIL